MLGAVYGALSEAGVFLEGTVLKTQMIMAGVDAPEKKVRIILPFHAPFLGEPTTYPICALFTVFDVSFVGDLFDAFDQEEIYFVQYGKGGALAKSRC